MLTVNPGETYFLKLIDILAEGLFVFSADGKILIYNSAAVRILKLSTPELEKCCIDFQSPSSISNSRFKIIKYSKTALPLAETCIIRAFQENRTIENEEIGLQWDDNSITWLEVSAVPFTDSQGEIEALSVTFRDITEQIQARKETEFYLREMTKIQEEERKRIARELHDDTAQSLAYISLELDSLVHINEITSPVLINRLASLKNRVNDSLNEVRRFSHELRPSVLDQLGLLAALETLIEELNSLEKVQVKFNISGTERRLSGEEELALFRIAQEALSNIRQHSCASKAEVYVKFTRNKVRMTITDDGKGFPSSEINHAAAKGRLGLIGMRERARLIGCNLIIKSTPNRGSLISLDLALPFTNLNQGRVRRHTRNIS